MQLHFRVVMIQHISSKQNPFVPQAIMRCRDTDRKDEHVKELGAHKIEFTTKGIAHYVVAMQSKTSFVV